jgi:hypothetical protein
MGIIKQDGILTSSFHISPGMMQFAISYVRLVLENCSIQLEMSSISHSQDIVDQEYVNSSVPNGFIKLSNSYKYIICEEYYSEDILRNTSLDAVQNSGIQGNYSEILDQLASSLDSPTKFQQEGMYSKQKYSTAGQISSSSSLNHADSTNGYNQILMSSSNETLFETPKDKSIELKSDTYSNLNHLIHNFNYEKVFRSDASDPAKKPCFVCPVDGCGKVFNRKANLRAHKDTHNPNRARPFACLTCSKSYLRSIDLMRHIETTHNKTQKHICIDCGKSFTRKEGLRKHQERGICPFSPFLRQ